MNENLITEQEKWRGTFTLSVVFVHLNFNRYDTNWKWKIYKWFSILDSFDHSPTVAPAFGKICRPAADTEKSARKRTTLALWVFRTILNMDRVIGSWLGLLNNRHMIKNTELEFEHWTDIACDKLERILFPPYIFIGSRGRKWWTFCNLGAWFWPNFRENRPMREKTLGNTNLVALCHTEWKILAPTQILHAIRYVPGDVQICTL